MLASVVNESSSTFLLYEACVNEYMNTWDDEWLDSIVLREMSEDEEYQLLYGFNDRGNPDLVGQKDNASFLPIKDEVLKMHPKNPFAAVKALDGIPFPSRAQGIGVHQDQAATVKALTFWTHPTTQTAMKVLPALAAGAGAASAIHKYRTQPKTVVAQKIASLRRVMYNLRHKMKMDSKNAPLYKRAINKVGELIDKLLEIVQKKTDKLFH